MLPRRKTWGTKSVWAASFFDLIPYEAEERAPGLALRQPPSTALPSLPSDSAAASLGVVPPQSNGGGVKAHKARKQLELDPRTRWRCRRCQAVLHPPVDTATGKPRYGVMLTEHLEGVSSGGTTHLATGVVVCAAGTLRYKGSTRPSVITDEAAVESKAAVNAVCKRPRDDVEEAAEGLSQDEVGEGHQAARDFLYRCCGEPREGRWQASSPSSAPRIFIVVENPKTPSNAGGILRAMHCYGVRGPTALGDDPVSPPAAPRADDGARGEGSGGGTSVESADGKDVAAVEVPPSVGGFVFSGTRLQRAMAQSAYGRALRTDPMQAGRDIPQLCIPTLQALFAVLRGDYAHQPGRASSVRVVAVELVEGATPLPLYTHPFCLPATSASARALETDRPDDAVAPLLSAENQVKLPKGPPMVFYIFGAEDGTLSAHHLDHDVDDVVFVPTIGSMNLASTVNVLLYDRLAKACGGALAMTETASANHAWRTVFVARNANNHLRWTPKPPDAYRTRG